MTVQPLRDDLMVQEQITGTWQHFVGVIMLNQTSRKQVKVVLPLFLSKWSTAESFLSANIDNVIEVIQPLGMYNRRARTLVKMSLDWLEWDGKNAKDLYGIGKYGSDSYEIFFKNNKHIDPSDKELRRYLGLPLAVKS